MDYTKALVNVRHVEGVKEHHAPGTPVLEAKNVTAGYDAQLLVLKNVSVRLEPSTTLAVVGESGSGKSTLARVLTGLLPAMQGESLLGDKKLARRDRKSTRLNSSH